jgi:hypothetical protein
MIFFFFFFWPLQLAFVLSSHGTGTGVGLGLLGDGQTFPSSDFDPSFSWSLAGKEEMALDFMRTIQTLAPGRILPSFKVTNVPQIALSLQMSSYTFIDVSFFLIHISL